MLKTFAAKQFASSTGRTMRLRAEKNAEIGMRHGLYEAVRDARIWAARHTAMFWETLF